MPENLLILLLGRYPSHTPCVLLYFDPSPISPNWHHCLVSLYSLYMGLGFRKWVSGEQALGVTAWPKLGSSFLLPVVTCSLHRGTSCLSLHASPTIMDYQDVQPFDITTLFYHLQSSYG